MHPIHAPGYSDFFASGFRAVSRRLAPESLSKRASSPKPIPLSFDNALSDSDSEDESLKRRSRRTSIFNPLSKSKHVPIGDSPRSSSLTSKPKKHHRSASLISNIFGRRQSRQTSAAAHVMSNDESGWLSSASSVSSADDDIDFMDLSTWPECPRGGLGCIPRATTELDSEPELLDPFSSSPSSKSFFVDVNPPSSNASTEEAISTRCNRPVSMSSWSTRFSFSSTSSGSSSSFFSSSRRNSLSIRPSSFLTSVTSPGSPPADTSFLHLPPVPRTNKRNSVERKRPASIHVMTTSSVSSPRASVSAAATTTAVASPIKTERRRSQTDILYSSGAQPFWTQSHTQSHSLPLSQLPSRSSRVRSLFLSTKAPSISAPIPEDKCDNETWPVHEAGNRSGSCGVVPSLNFISISSPVSQVPDRVSEVDDESDDIVVESEPDSDTGPQAPVVVGLDEEEAPSSASDARVFFGNEMDDDVPKRVDWREFCIEVLDGHSDA